MLEPCFWSWDKFIWWHRYHYVLSVLRFCHFVMPIISWWALASLWLSELLWKYDVLLGIEALRSYSSSSAVRLIIFQWRHGVFLHELSVAVLWWCSRCSCGFCALVDQSDCHWSSSAFVYHIAAGMLLDLNWYRRPSNHCWYMSSFLDVAGLEGSGEIAFVISIFAGLILVGWHSRDAGCDPWWVIGRRALSHSLWSFLWILLCLQMIFIAALIFSIIVISFNLRILVLVARYRRPKNARQYPFLIAIFTITHFQDLTLRAALLRQLIPLLLIIWTTPIFPCILYKFSFIIRFLASICNGFPPLPKEGWNRSRLMIGRTLKLISMPSHSGLMLQITR